MTVERFLTRGTPQGGILSPLMWNICFDSLLRSFNTSLVKCVGFADDGALLTWGKHPNVLVSRMQKAIDTATAWGKEQGLTFSATKTVAVIFTRKGSQNCKPFPPPCHLTTTRSRMWGKLSIWEFCWIKN